ncbi:unnamed protein product [Adineta steineri]|uniref:Uncharacterized protein n=1 Tax=Adineta steineri TaxID=433720 RepID=A0A819HR24_9BILA|nr:unnamed protein product [Adineta steineri]CAF1309354.1 unnamed protein product [Adineta steineri]CAF1410028.1 unnamed protein product [Adineta steineri]CAF3824916.1 unnamed protein product [Adineta steineri]CAF3906270.1 unnamed protein product [Adineta steineri]
MDDRSNMQDLVERFFGKRGGCLAFGAACTATSNPPCCGPAHNCLDSGFCICVPVGGPCKSNTDCCGNGGSYTNGNTGGNYISCLSNYCNIRLINV